MTGYDIIGDVHGCADELETLLARLGYEVRKRRDGFGLASGPVYAHPDGRIAARDARPRLAHGDARGDLRAGCGAAARYALPHR